MTRRKKLRLIKAERRFRDEGLSMNEEDQLREHIMNRDDVQGLSIRHGWTTWVEVTMFNGQRYLEDEFWTTDSLRNIVKKIYNSVINKPNQQ